MALRSIALLSLPLVALAVAPGLPLEGRDLFDPVCVSIASAISSASNVYYPGHPKYTSGIFHWGSSSSELSKCVVEPGTPADVGVTLGIVGSTRTPFAVKGGGHSSNPGFSSTTGVHISMARFSAVTYDAATQTVEVGAGLKWDDVYEALEPYNVNVVGGRVSGVGVAGFTLGGGYSWKTNQYGLTIDTVVAYELVKPDGSTVTTVTKTSDPAKLFFGLKGGLNNFTHPQTQVWGGIKTITANHIDDVAAATAAFNANVTDPKASVLTTYNFLLGQPGIVLILFYDGPTPPAGIFDDFLAIPHFTSDVKTRSFLSLVQASPAELTSGARVIFNSVSLIDLSPNILDVILNETVYWGQQLSLKSGIFISYDVEPFLPNLYSHNPDTTAFPPVRSLGLLPLNIYFAWTISAFDNDFYDAAKASAKAIYDAAIAEGQTSAIGAPIYPNYAIFDTPLSNIYGDNVPALQALKARVDPSNVMGLAGGFKF
ncbi:hypothetical protein D9613_006783 [Agrocybe pediades]|uniref:FAD-binding PCMH-type domain-containing protein n=1 Tax=Agrocybe pediades TaxID=84607 RepID=A0A8H4QGM4_9AGAR|nr:hypothetical protein D9613_006783 [Agrocybe pediades]